jgi:glycosyltransferase involved in cell wall biosynthesis
MNIWIITKYASSLENGFESRPFALAKNFTKKGYKCSIITSDSNHFGVYPKYQNVYNFFSSGDINVLRIKTFKYSRTVSIKRVVSWFNFEIKLLFAPLQKLSRPDVIIVSSLSLITILNGIRLKKLYKSKLVFEIRDIWPLTMIEEGGYSKFNPFVMFLGWIEKKGYLNSDLIVGSMPNLSSHVTNVTSSKSIRCECVPFGYDPIFFSKNTVNSIYFTDKYQIPTDKFIIGYAGSMGLSNGLDAIIESISQMKSDSRFLFLFLGDGACKKCYQERTKGLTNVIFIPKVKRDEVSSFLELCDLLYFSALRSKIWEYGWSPNKLIDYMMAGKPVLASYSGYKSMINEANSGFFIDAENPQEITNALNEIILLPKERLLQMGANGKSWVIKNRQWEVVANTYLDYINSLFK